MMRTLQRGLPFPDLDVRVLGFDLGLAAALLVDYTMEVVGGARSRRCDTP